MPKYPPPHIQTISQHDYLYMFSFTGPGAETRHTSLTLLLKRTQAAVLLSLSFPKIFLFLQMKTNIDHRYCTMYFSCVFVNCFLLLSLIFGAFLFNFFFFTFFCTLFKLSGTLYSGTCFKWVWKIKLSRVNYNDEHGHNITFIP